MSRIVLTDGSTPSNVTSGSTQVYTKGTGLFYKQGSNPEVGPLSTGGGTVTDLQTAYDGGNTITVDAGVPVTLTGVATGSVLEVSKPVASSGDALKSSSAGSGSAIYAEAQDAGNGVTVYASNPSSGTGVSVFVDGAGLAIEATVNEATSTNPTIRAITQSTNGSASAITARVASVASAATGISVEMIDAFASGVGIAVSQAGSGNALYATSASTTDAVLQGVSTGAGSASAIKAEVTNAGSTADAVLVTSNSTSGNGIRAVLTDGATTAHTIRADHSAAGSNLHLVRSGGVGNFISTSTGTFSVDKDGDTTTPSVIFGGSRITVEGDSGGSGDPLNPRMSRTSGAVDVGVLDRVYCFYSKVTGDIDLESVLLATNTIPTTFQFENSSGVTHNVKLLNAARYPNGAEIVVINLGSTSINLIDGVGRTLVNLTGAGVSPLLIGSGTGRRLMALNFGNSGGSGSTFWVTTGTF